MGKDDLAPQHCRFAIDTTPFCAWDFNISTANITYLQDFDPLYFDSVACSLSTPLESDKNSLRAALNLRALYAQTSESFAAVLFAALQAPSFIPAWLDRYKMTHLRDLAEKALEQKVILNRWGFDRSWLVESARFFHPHPTYQEGFSDRIAKAWRIALSDMCNVDVANEYNGIKHGLRVAPGGHTYLLGSGSFSDSGEYVPAPVDDLHVFRASKFGSTYYTGEPVVRPHHFRLLKHSQNWTPRNLLARVRVMSMSMHNIRETLLARFDLEKESVDYAVPADFLLDAATQADPARIRSSFNSDIRSKDVKKYTKDEILSVYEDPLVTPRPGLDSTT